MNTNNIIFSILLFYSELKLYNLKKIENLINMNRHGIIIIKTCLH